ncbi:hypothetical protein O7607_26510 [Micromonospora sp. WMMA1949]|uniref:hypothetical protein n=1 Tax=Micromonospora sp. WMMA1949 TaxID=3015162 RepID=UPI0022B71AE7|nr:hypothetical protein [Micromonospora sp. WMMA1949]MCZ7429315.1 hypothetical protein [Micromonospora sp. WMMA1949]
MSSTSGANVRAWISGSVNRSAMIAPSFARWSASMTSRAVQVRSTTYGAPSRTAGSGSRSAAASSATRSSGSRPSGTA